MQLAVCNTSLVPRPSSLLFFRHCVFELPLSAPEGRNNSGFKADSSKVRFRMLSGDSEQRTVGGMQLAVCNTSLVPRPSSLLFFRHCVFGFPLSAPEGAKHICKTNHRRYSAPEGRNNSGFKADSSKAAAEDVDDLC